MKAPKTKRLRWSDLTPFPDNPPVSATRVARLRRERGGYSPTAVGTPEVGDNSALAFPDHPEDTLFILDGNNRYEIARQEDCLDQEVIVKLWTGLSEGEMHELCDGINDRRTTKPAERFLRRCKSEKFGATQRAIRAAVEETGWIIDYERGPGKLACTKELEWIWAGGKRPGLNDGAHSGALLRAITSFEEAWGRDITNDRHTRQASLIKGLGAFWLLYPDADFEGVISAIKGLEPKELYDKGRQRRSDLRLTHLYNGLIDVIRNRYNKGRRSGKLAERHIGRGGVASWSQA